MYSLTNEDLTHLGLPMGMEYTEARWTKYYTTSLLAKKAAEKEYGKRIDWHKEGDGFRSPDLGHTMYHIRKVVPEK